MEKVDEPVVSSRAGHVACITAEGNQYEEPGKEYHRRDDGNQCGLSGLQVAVAVQEAAGENSTPNWQKNSNR